MKKIILIVGFFAFFCSAFGMQSKNIIMENNKPELAIFLSQKCCNSTIAVAWKSSYDIGNTMMENAHIRDTAIDILNILSITDERQRNFILYAKSQHKTLSPQEMLTRLKCRLRRIFTTDCQRTFSTKDSFGHRQSLVMSIIDYPEKCKTVATLLQHISNRELNKYLIECIADILSNIIISITTCMTNNSTIKDSITDILKEDMHACSAAKITSIFLRCCTPTWYFQEYYYDLIYKIASDILDHQELRDEMLLLLNKKRSSR